MCFARLRFLNWKSSKSSKFSKTQQLKKTIPLSIHLIHSSVPSSSREERKERLVIKKKKKMERIAGNENIRNNNGEGDKLGDKFFFSLPSLRPRWNSSHDADLRVLPIGIPLGGAVPRTQEHPREEREREKKRRRIRIIGREREARNSGDGREGRREGGIRR